MHNSGFRVHSFTFEYTCLYCKKVRIKISEYNQAFKELLSYTLEILLKLLIAFLITSVVLCAYLDRL